MMNRIVLLALIAMLLSGFSANKVEATLAAQTQKEIILELYAPLENQPKTISTSPDEKIVISTVKAQEWKDITFIVLRIDVANWFEVSGSLKSEDGLSARYSENGVEHVSKRAPKTLDECIGLLLSYLRGDEKWKKEIPWD